MFERLVLVCAAAVALSFVALLALHEQARQARQAQPEEALQALRAQQAAGPEGDKPARADALGDPLPPGAVARLGTLRLRQVLRDGSGAAAVAFSPDGKMLAAAGEVGVLVWDVGSGRELGWLGGKARGTAVRFSADGKALTTASNNGAFQVWETGTGKLLRERKPARDFHMLVTGAFFSADGRVLGGVNMEGELRLWDVPGGGLVFTRKGPGRSLWFSAALSHDGKAVVVSGEGNRAHLFDTATGREARVFEGPNKALHLRAGFGRLRAEAVFGFTFSPDGRLLAATGETSFCVWEAATGKLRYAVQGHHGRLAFSPDGKYLAVGSEEGIRLYEAAGGREVRRFEPPGGWVLALAFSPDGRVLAAGEVYTVSLWDVASGRRRHHFAGHTSPVASLAFSPDGAALASGGEEDGKALVWDLATRKPVHALTGHHRSVVCMAWSPDGTALATGDGMSSGSDYGEAQVRLWGRADGRLRRQFTAHLNGVRGLAFTPDGKRLATAGGDARARLWDAATGKRLYQVRGSDGLNRAALSPDGRLLLVGGHADLALHRADTGEKLRDVGAGGQVRRQIVSAAFLPDGKTVLTREGRPADRRQPAALRFWDADSGRLLRSIPVGGTGGGAAYALAPDGKTLAVAGDDFRDHSIGLWDLVSGVELKRLHGHAGTVLALAFSPDGKTLASGSRDTTVLLWDVSRARLEHLVAQLGRGGGAAARAVEALAANPREAVGLLKDQLRRSAEAEARVNGLLAGLDDDQFEVREKASRELEKLGPEAAPALRLALEGALPAESRARIQKALDAMKPAGAADPQAVWLALAVLEEIDTPEARQALEELARGPAGATVTRGARAALARLAKKGPGRKSP